jgi:hypothetical protein
MRYSLPMAHHAYIYAGGREEGTEEARGFAARELSLEGEANPDIIERSYSLLSVEDARALRDIATLSAVGGGSKVLIVSVERMFHEAQNALLKLFEEPPEDTVLILIVPTTGIVLGTLRSRVVPLPSVPKKRKTAPMDGIGSEFLEAGAAGREKLISKLLDRSKSDKDEEKQAARADSLRILEALERRTHEAWVAKDVAPKKAGEYAQFLNELDRFIPILHERSAPLKQIFEHVLIVLPSGL